MPGDHAPDRRRAARTRSRCTSSPRRAGSPTRSRSCSPGARVFYVRNGIAKDVFAAARARASRGRGPLRVLIEGYRGTPVQGRRRGGRRRSRAMSRAAPPDRSSSRTATSPATSRRRRVLGRGRAGRAGRACYASTDVVLKLSRVEGMFGPPLEGFHRGATCVVTPVTGHDEYVAHGWNGLVIDWDDVRGHGAPARPARARPALPALPAHQRAGHRARVAVVGAVVDVHGGRATASQAHGPPPDPTGGRRRCSPRRRRRRPQRLRTRSSGRCERELTEFRWLKRRFAVPRAAARGGPTSPASLPYPLAPLRPFRRGAAERAPRRGPPLPFPADADVTAPAIRRRRRVEALPRAPRAREDAQGARAASLAAAPDRRACAPCTTSRFDVPPGEFFGIVGRNGSGKSTLLKCLAGIYAVDSGRIYVAGGCRRSSSSASASTWTCRRATT